MNEEYSKETEQAIEVLLESGFSDCNVCNHGKQINVMDKDGIIHTFYPTTGTILFHFSNKKYDNKLITIRNETVETFIDFLCNPLIIGQLFDQKGDK